MKQRLLLTASACTLLAMTVPATVGCGSHPPAANQGATDIAQREQVIAGKAERKTLTLSTTQPGRIEAFEETPLYAKVAGYVDHVLADIGDVVRKDQVLAKLAVPELVDDLDQRDALVAQAEAEVKQAGSAVEAAVAAAQTAESRIAESEAGIARCEAEHDRWKSEYARIQELAAKGSVTKRLEEETLNQARAAEAAKREAVAKVESARAAYYEAQANVGKSRADQGAAEARLQVAKALLARARTMLAYTEIKAPYDGMITRREVDTGHFVQPATAGDAKPLFVVARMDKVRIFVEVPELEAPYVDAGDPAQVRVQALETMRFDAQVVRTSWSLLEVNRSLRAEVDVPNPSGLLRPGMYATVTIRLDERSDALILPAVSILREGDKTYCMCVESGRIQKRPVELGLRSGGEVEVTSGVDADCEVVLKGPEALKAGQQVRLTPPAK
jgi:RND family efflux transporter MFP subunit